MNRVDRVTRRCLVGLATLIVAAVLVGGCSAQSSPQAGQNVSAASSHAASARPSHSSKPKPTPTQTKHANSKPSGSVAKTGSSTANVTISFVSVGQGDGIVIKAGSWAGLIDGGPAGSNGEVAAVLSRLGVHRLNAVVATHPHADHIGDLAVLVREYRPQVAYSDDTASTATYRSFVAALRAVHARIDSVFRGQTLAFGPLRARVLNPTGDGSDPNADSIVLLLTVDGKQVLLIGDDTGPSEQYVASVCARGPPL
jgi:competence protein ComEC